MNEIVIVIDILLVLLPKYVKPAQTFNSVAPDSSSCEFTTSNIIQRCGNGSTISYTYTNFK